MVQQNRTLPIFILVIVLFSSHCPPMVHISQIQPSCVKSNFHTFLDSQISRSKQYHLTYNNSIVCVPSKLAVVSIARHGLQWINTVRSKSGSGESELVISCLVLLKGV